jgi:HK97 family phage portal protein
MTFVISAGAVQRLQTGPPLGWGWSAYASGSIEIGANKYATYAEIWRQQPAVRTVVGFLARNLAQLGVDVFEKHGEAGADRRKARDHPLSALLHRPFPGSTWTRYRLISWTVHELCIYDSAIWIKGRGDDGAPSLLPMPRRYITPVGDNPLMPEGYLLEGTRGRRILDPDEVVHFHGYNPDDLRQGVSPIETLRQILAEEYAAGEYREQMWRNGARTGGVIQRPRDAPRWSADARERFGHDWRENYAGDGPQAGGTAVLEDGMTYHATGITPRDAQYVESRRLTREEVAIAYHINPQILGVSAEGSTKASAEEIHNQLYQDTLGPWLAQLSQDIETQLLADLDPTAVDGSVYVEFNIGEKLRGSFEKQVAALQSSVGGPWMTRTEARQMFNLPHLDEADDLIVPLNVTQGGLASPNDTAPDNPSNAESNGEVPGPKPAELSAERTQGDA